MGLKSAEPAAEVAYARCVAAMEKLSSMAMYCFLRTENAASAIETLENVALVRGRGT